MQEIIFEERYFYQFYKEKDNYYLSVLCGTVAQFDITIQLSDTEIKTYHLKGKNYIVIKANEIFNDPEKFVSRKI